MGRLQDKVAIITGGASGIGKATAALFAKEGARVVIWDVQVEKGIEVASQLEGKFYQVNTTDYIAVEEVARAVMEDFGKIDILINNAGITRDATLKNMTAEQWQQVMDVNLTGVFNCAKAVQGYMVERSYGRIINASSVVGIYGNFGQTNYVATKAGVIGMTKVWARELGRKGITVNAIAPGFIATEMVNTIPDNMLKMMQEKNPLGRIGKPEEVAYAYLFLASDEASFINGAILSVDGGMTT